jgi:predicted Zn finger-like uncharacterized protein
MRIACPNCAAEYDVPEALLAAGPRLLRCARCGHQFQAALPGSAAPAADAQRDGRPDAPTDLRTGAVAGGPVGGLVGGPVGEPVGGPARREAASPSRADRPEPDRPVPDRLAPDRLAPDRDVPPPAAPPPAIEGDRPPPTRGLARHSPMDPPLPPSRAPASESPRGTAMLAVAWLLSLALVGAGAWAALTYRAEITEAWPPAARLYQALGLG